MDDDTYFHVTYFRETIDTSLYRTIASISFGFDANHDASEIWERISYFPLSSLYDIGPDCNANVLYEVVTQLIYSVCALVAKEHVNILLCGHKQKNQLKCFLINTATVTEQGGQIRYLHLNRFLIKSVSGLPLKLRTRMMQNQLNNINNLLHILFFTKITNRNLKKAPYPNCTNCKLTAYEERFIHGNVAELHILFCHTDNSSSNERLQTLIRLFPEASDCIKTASAVVANATTILETCKQRI